MGQSLYKNAVAPGVNNVWQTLYTAPIGQSSLLLQLNGSVTGSAGVSGSARIWDNSAGVYANLIRYGAVPIGDTIQLIDAAKIVLEEQDRIEVRSDDPIETLDYVASLIEDVTDETIGIFKNAIVPNVDDSAWFTIYEAPALKSSYALQINASNNADTGVQISLRLYDASALQYVSLLTNGVVPLGDALRLIDNSKLVLEPGDRIEATCLTPGESLDLVGCIIEDVNQV